MSQMLAACRASAGGCSLASVPDLKDTMHMRKSTFAIRTLVALIALQMTATALAASGIQNYTKATEYYRELDRPDHVLLRFETAPDAFVNSELPTEKFLRKNPALTLAGAGIHQEAYEGLFNDRMEHFKRELRVALRFMPPKEDSDGQSQGSIA